MHTFGILNSVQVLSRRFSQNSILDIFVFLKKFLHSLVRLVCSSRSFSLSLRLAIHNFLLCSFSLACSPLHSSSTSSDRSFISPTCNIVDDIQFHNQNRNEIRPKNRKFLLLLLFLHPTILILIVAHELNSRTRNPHTKWKLSSRDEIFKFFEHENENEIKIETLFTLMFNVINFTMVCRRDNHYQLVELFEQ